MEKINVPCPGCGDTLRVGSTYFGKKIRCPKCKAVVAVPGGKSDTPAPAPRTNVTASRKSGRSADDNRGNPARRRRPAADRQEKKPRRRGLVIVLGVLLVGCVILLAITQTGVLEPPKPRGPQAQVKKNDPTPNLPPDTNPENKPETQPEIVDTEPATEINEGSTVTFKGTAKYGIARLQNAEGYYFLIEMNGQGWRPRLELAHLLGSGGHLQVVEDNKKSGNANSLKAKLTLVKDGFENLLIAPQDDFNVTGKPLKYSMKVTVPKIGSDQGGWTQSEGEVLLGSHKVALAKDAIYHISVSSNGRLPRLLMKDNRLQGVHSSVGEFGGYFEARQAGPSRIILLPSRAAKAEESADPIEYSLRCAHVPFEKEPLIQVAGELVGDPKLKDSIGCYFQTFDVKLDAGRVYVIDLHAPPISDKVVTKVPTRLLLENDQKQRAAIDVAGVDGSASRIIYRPVQSGGYRVVATSSQPGLIYRFRAGFECIAYGYNTNEP